MKVDLAEQMDIMEECVDHLGDRFGEMVAEGVNIAETLENDMIVINQTWERIVACIEVLTKNKDTANEKSLEFEKGLQEKEDLMATMEEKLFTLQDAMTMMRSRLEEEGVKITPLNGGNRFVGERVDGSVDIINVPKGIDLTNPKNKIWDEETSEYLMTFDKGFKVSWPFLKKILLIQPKNTPVTKAMKKKREQNLFVMNLRKEGEKWKDVEKKFHSKFKTKVSFKTLQKRLKEFSQAEEGA